MIEGGELDALVRDRYAGWQAPDAQAMLSGGSSLEAISDAAVAKGIDPRPRSGRQEYVENLVSRYI
jgi:xylose isomerase